MLAILSMIAALVLGRGQTVGTPQAPDRAIVKTVLVKAPVKEVWRAWTTSQGMKDVLGANCNIELMLGGRYEILFSDQPPVGAQGSEGCQVLSFVPERMLSFSWNAPPSIPAMRHHRTFVVVTLTPSGEETTVELRHAGWRTGQEWDKTYAYFDNAWGFVLSALQKRFVDGPTKEQLPPLSKQAKPDLTALDKMSTMIGGVWRGQVDGPDGKPMIVEFTYKRHKDGKGIVGEGVIGKGRKDASFVHSQFGWDPIGKAVYYFDTHNSETLYFGHVLADGDDLIFTFSPIGFITQAWQTRSRLKGDTIQSIIRDSKGAEVVGLTLKRSK